MKFSPSSKQILLILTLAFLAVGCNTQDVVEFVPPTKEFKEEPAQGIENNTIPEQVSQASQVPASSQVQNKVVAEPIISYKGVEGKTALELLKASHKVETKDFSGLGEYVESIDGYKPDAKHFWKFFVNGKSSTVGASSYITKSSDVLEWKTDKIGNE